eukprot:bmy_00349T0
MPALGRGSEKKRQSPLSCEAPLSSLLQEECLSTLWPERPQLLLLGACFLNHKKRSERYPPSKRSKHCGSEGSPNILRRAPTRRNKLDLHAIIKFPLTTESALKKIEDNSTPVFIVEVKANEYQI